MVASDAAGGAGGGGSVVSIPFIAGQWSLRKTFLAERLARASLNPLHCGAVVASRRRGARARCAARVSIPFIAGQWSLPCAASVSVRADTQVSIPFIAGQWSLRRDHAAAARRFPRLNPLHCGAVVASVPPWIRGVRHARHVSIPFIAGQWSLPARPRVPGWWTGLSQSPSLRGSGRFYTSG